ncbi:type IV pilus twitching motility protein PilT [uncultured Megasphaera sp.]|uniref:type IV pilus twitching motility protein PilT n=1 Tax=uncultured Megasphaera sp. TaxID=165188 RepID=UPI00265976C6|nr:ATPase, T2SS/T4P/T4SS family [uncultured Megasphaera sp.]
MELNDVLQAAADSGATDVHLQEGRLPLLRIRQRLTPWGQDAVCRQDIRQILQTLQLPEPSERGDSAAAFSWNGGIRCRLHVSVEHAGFHAALRLLYPLHFLPPDADEALLHRLGGLNDGLVLICGATGSGKTTALWRILSDVNEQRPCHIITLEDPIEYVLAGQQALISQREEGTHFFGFADAVRDALRQDPDILLIGEMRDKETMSAALAAAETGHLVFATLHTRSAAQAISRLTGSYDGEEQNEIRNRLALVMQAILAQQRRCDEQGTYILREILLHTPAVAQLIRTGCEHQLTTVMQTGGALGMRTMEQAVQAYRQR